MSEINWKAASLTLTGLIIGLGAVLYSAATGNAADSIDRSKLTKQAVLPQVANDEENVVLGVIQPPPTSTKTNIPSPTGSPSATNSPPATGTATSSPTPTKTSVQGTPTAVRTNTPQPTSTKTPLPGSTATNTPVPTNTPATTPTATNTPSPTPTSQANTPLIDYLDPDTVVEGTRTVFITGSNFTPDSVVHIKNLSEGPGIPNIVGSPQLEFQHSASLKLTYNFTFYSHPYVVTETVLEVKVVSSNGTSNGKILTVTQPPPPPCIGEDTYMVVGTTPAVDFDTVYVSHRRPCSGDMVTVRVTVNEAAPAASMYFRFANGSCFPQQQMAQVSTNVWEATIQFNGPTTEVFGYRIDATNAGGSSSAVKLSTTSGAPFGGCDGP